MSLKLRSFSAPAIFFLFFEEGSNSNMRRIRLLSLSNTLAAEIIFLTVIISPCNYSHDYEFHVFSSSVGTIGRTIEFWPGKGFVEDSH